MVGVDFPVLEFWRGKIKSLTTDMGTEIKMLDCKDVLYAFLQHLCGVTMASLAGTVSACSRLFNKAVRISGWSHLFGKCNEIGSQAFHTLAADHQAATVVMHVFQNGNMETTNCEIVCRGSCKRCGFVVPIHGQNLKMTLRDFV